MQWLLHGSLTPAAGEALVRHGHKIHAMDEVALGEDALPPDIIAAAQKKQWDLLTTSALLPQAISHAHLRYDRSVVHLQLEGGDVEQDDAIDRLFARYKRLAPGRLYVVTGSRVKVRQLAIRQRH